MKKERLRFVMTPLSGIGFGLRDSTVCVWCNDAAARWSGLFGERAAYKEGARKNGGAITPTDLRHTSLAR